MARKATKKTTNAKTTSFEQNLWDTVNKLRGSVESSEYKHVVLSLIFLKFASDKFEERRAELMAEGKEKYMDMVEFYTMKNVFYLPEASRWSYISSQAKQDDLAIKIDTALATVEKNNASLKGALPDNYFSRLNLDTGKLAALIDSISNINTVADQKRIAELYGTSVSNINQHISAIYEDEDLLPEATIKKYLIVQTEGSRQVKRLVDHYNLDMIIGVGFRVRSKRGSQFRKWATERISEYLVKGFTMDDERLKGNAGVVDHFDELLARIRESAFV